MITTHLLMALAGVDMTTMTYTSGEVEYKVSTSTHELMLEHQDVSLSLALSETLLARLAESLAPDESDSGCWLAGVVAALGRATETHTVAEVILWVRRLCTLSFQAGEVLSAAPGFAFPGDSRILPLLYEALQLRLSMPRTQALSRIHKDTILRLRYHPEAIEMYARWLSVDQQALEQVVAHAHTPTSYVYADALALPLAMGEVQRCISRAYHRGVSMTAVALVLDDESELKDVDPVHLATLLHALPPISPANTTEASIPRLGKLLSALQIDDNAAENAAGGQLVPLSEALKRLQAFVLKARDLRERRNDLQLPLAHLLSEDEHAHVRLHDSTLPEQAYLRVLIPSQWEHLQTLSARSSAYHKRRLEKGVRLELELLQSHLPRGLAQWSTGAKIVYQKLPVSDTVQCQLPSPYGRCSPATVMHAFLQGCLEVYFQQTKVLTTAGGSRTPCQADYLQAIEELNQLTAPDAEGYETALAQCASFSIEERDIAFVKWWSTMSGDVLGRIKNRHLRAAFGSLLQEAVQAYVVTGTVESPWEPIARLTRLLVT